jgi:hypothetical protein
MEPPVCLHEDDEGGNACICGLFAVFIVFPDSGLAIDRSL